MSRARLADFLIFRMAMAVMLAARITKWRWQPYTAEEFDDATERIRGGARELLRWWDDPVAERRLPCRSMLQDMARNTCQILEALDDWLAGGSGHENALDSLAGEVARQGSRLLLRLRWTEVRLALLWDTRRRCALALDAAERYGRLSSAVAAFLEARFEERPSRRHRARRRRVGGRAAL